MPTLGQLCKKNTTRKPKYRKNRSKTLQGCPQKKAICVRVYTMSPKKPNSARRRVARVTLFYRKRNKHRLLFFRKQITAHIPGEGHSLQQHSVVLLRGGRVKDLPGVKCRIVRGIYDLGPVANRKKGRSRYGTPKPALSSDTQLNDFLEKKI